MSYDLSSISGSNRSVAPQSSMQVSEGNRRFREGIVHLEIDLKNGDLSTKLKMVSQLIEIAAAMACYEGDGFHHPTRSSVRGNVQEPPTVFFDPDSQELAPLENLFSSVIYGRGDKNRFMQLILSETKSNGKTDLRLLGHLVYSAILWGYLKEIPQIIESLFHLNGDKEAMKDALRQAALRKDFNRISEILDVEVKLELSVVVVIGDLSAPKGKSLKLKQLSPADFVDSIQEAENRANQQWLLFRRAEALRQVQRNFI